MPELTDIVITAAPPLEADRGLLGWASCVVDGRCRLDGLAIRRTRQGELLVTFPARRDRHGTRHPYVWPLESDDRASIERQVLEALAAELAP